MNRKPYPFKQLEVNQFFFISEGRKRIAKGINFMQIADNVVNLCFGDLSPDGSVDDTVNSNNGDIVKIMSTVLDVLRQFCLQHPDMQVYIEGSTALRTMLYTRILKNYYTTLSREFSIMCIIKDDDSFELVSYDPLFDLQYWAFLIKRKS